jgi:hypothetical protein
MGTGFPSLIICAIMGEMKKSEAWSVFITMSAGWILYLRTRRWLSIVASNALSALLVVSIETLAIAHQPRAYEMLSANRQLIGMLGDGLPSNLTCLLNASSSAGKLFMSGFRMTPLSNRSDASC